jgi:hypothetical protein
VDSKNLDKKNLVHSLDSMSVLKFNITHCLFGWDSRIPRFFLIQIHKIRWEPNGAKNSLLSSLQTTHGLFLTRGITMGYPRAHKLSLSKKKLMRFEKRLRDLWSAGILTLHE